VIADRPRRRIGVSVAVIAAASLLCATASCSHRSATADAAQTTLQVSVGKCGQGWTDPKPGQQTLVVHNSDISAADVSLVDPASGKVYATVEPLGAGRSANMPITLAPGNYALRCAVEDQDVVTGPTVSVPADGWSAGPTPVASPVLPVTQGDLIKPTQAYEAYVNGQLPTLASEVDRLRTDLESGNDKAAKTAWLTAHMEYERLGAAYDAFGDADGEINGLAEGLPKGVADPGFTGFHRIEFDLWRGGPQKSLVSESDDLASAVAGLQAEFKRAEIDPLDVSIRAHEISENALEFELTSRTDYGSHSQLATIRANMDGTQKVLAILWPLLQGRYADLNGLTSALDRTEADLDAQDHNGNWTPLAALTVSQREDIDSDISDLSERLSSVASICEPRRQQ
jgi:iron uptake system component EfeO